MEVQAGEEVKRAIILVVHLTVGDMVEMEQFHRLEYMAVQEVHQMEAEIMEEEAEQEETALKELQQHRHQQQIKEAVAWE